MPPRGEWSSRSRAAYSPSSSSFDRYCASSPLQAAPSPQWDCSLGKETVFLFICLILKNLKTDRNRCTNGGKSGNKRNAHPGDDVDEKKSYRKGNDKILGIAKKRGSVESLLFKLSFGESVSQEEPGWTTCCWISAGDSVETAVGRTPLDGDFGGSELRLQKMN